MSDGMDNIGKAGQPMEWSTNRSESPKQDEEVADKKFSGKETRGKRKSDTFLKKEAAKNRKPGRPTTLLSERSTQKTAVRSQMRADTGKYDINQICMDYQSKLLSAKTARSDVYNVTDVF